MFEGYLFLKIFNSNIIFGIYLGVISVRPENKSFLREKQPDTYIDKGLSVSMYQYIANSYSENTPKPQKFAQSQKLSVVHDLNSWAKIDTSDSPDCMYGLVR